MAALYTTGIGATRFAFTMTPGNSLDLRAQAVSAGWDQARPLLATLNGAAQSASSASPALTVSGAFPSGVALINNGTISGCKGGTGSTGGDGIAGTAGSMGAGGLAGTPTSAAGGIGSAGGNATDGAKGSDGGPGGTGGTGLSVGTSLVVKNLGSISAGVGGNGGPYGNGGAAGVRSGGGGGGSDGTLTVYNGKDTVPGTYGVTGGNGYSVASGPATTTSASAGGASGASGGTSTSGRSGGIAGAPASPGGVGAQGNPGSIGNYISGNANINWTSVGTLSGNVA